MSEIRVGFPGYRGMVGSVVTEGLQAGHAGRFEPVFLSTSEEVIGTESPILGGEAGTVAGAKDLDVLSGLDIIVSCQPDDYAEETYSELRGSGWNGIFIDASGALRQRDTAIIASDVINGKQIKDGLHSGVKEFAGPNCSSNILLMGADGLFATGAVERVTFWTAQAVSGAGADAVLESLAQNDFLPPITDTANPLEAMRMATSYLRSRDLPVEQFSAAIAANILAKIGSLKPNRQTSEEAKAEAEINKILGNQGEQTIAMDGFCNRIDSLRSHSIEAVFELTRDIELSEVEERVGSAHQWVKLIPNEDQAVLEQLHPVAVSETLNIAVGRLRHMTNGPRGEPRRIGGVFIGDQLRWGAAQPLLRTLDLALEYLE